MKKIFISLLLLNATVLYSTEKDFNDSIVDPSFGIGIALLQQNTYLGIELYDIKNNLRYLTSLSINLEDVFPNCNPEIDIQIKSNKNFEKQLHNDTRRAYLFKFLAVYYPALYQKVINQEETFENFIYICTANTLIKQPDFLKDINKIKLYLDCCKSLKNRTKSKKI